MLRSTLKRGLLLLLLATAALASAHAPYWIDVRTPEEYAGGHVSQAVDIPYQQISDRIGEVTTDKDALIYLYCRSGHRAGIAKAALEDAGYSNVINLGSLEEALKKAAEEPSAQ